jgi:hypothetical protein
LVKLDDLGRDRVFLGQPVQGVVQGEEIVIRVGGRRVGEFDPAKFAAPLLPRLAAGGLDQDATHGLGRRGEEVSPAVPSPVRVAADQSQVGLVHQSRGLERLTRRLSRQLPSGQPAQLVVDQREQLAGRLPLPQPRASRMRVTSPTLRSIATSST